MGWTVLPLFLLCTLTMGGEVAISTQKCAAQGCGEARSAHWVIRTTDLSKALEFYKSVLGMQVIRHEENPEACPITCNGNTNAAWSKTMVGYGTEDKGYALEIIYNYGAPGWSQRQFE